MLNHDLIRQLKAEPTPEPDAGTKPPDSAVWRLLAADSGDETSQSYLLRGDEFKVGW